jgi:hypothetical protein
VEKIEQLYVLPKIYKNKILQQNFDLWFFQGAHDLFINVIKNN